MENFKKPPFLRILGYFTPMKKKLDDFKKALLKLDPEPPKVLEAEVIDLRQRTNPTLKSLLDARVKIQTLKLKKAH